MCHEFLLQTRAKERLEDNNGLLEQNFEERTKSFILRAQQRFEILEKKRKINEGKFMEALVLDKEFRIKRQAEREESAFSDNRETTESSNPLKSLIEKLKNQSGKVAKDLRERWGDTWNRTVEVVKDGVSHVQESAKEVGEDFGKRWDLLKDSTSTFMSNKTNIEEFVTRQREGDSSKKGDEVEPSKGGLVNRIRGLFSSGSR